MEPLQIRKEDDAKVMVRQMNIFSVFTILIDFIGMIYALIKINQEYGGFKAVFSNAPQGKLIKRIDIPVINVYWNIQVEVNGVWQWAGHFWF